MNSIREFYDNASNHLQTAETALDIAIACIIRAGPMRPNDAGKSLQRSMLVLLSNCKTELARTHTEFINLDTQAIENHLKSRN